MARDRSYTIGHKEGPLAYMRLRTAERSCSFFRHHIRPDSQILDCGCGPGSITVGLAQWAMCGQTIGIDIGEEQLEGARALAHELGAMNVSFQQGNIFALPFEDDSFDVVFSQTVLYHIPSPRRALSEIRRVLRPGGLIALRDAINTSIISWPEESLIEELVRIVRLGALHSGGNPDVGRELGTLLHSEGFDNVFFNLSFEQPERPEERLEYFSRVAGLMDGNLATLAVSEGWSTAERLAEAAERCRELANIPGSIFALPFGQAVGRKPA